VLLEASHLGGHQPAYTVRIFSKGSHIDDWVGRIVVDIGNRGEGQVDSDRAAFERGDAAELIRVGVAPCGRHAHIGWEVGAAVQPDRGTGFEVGADQQRQWGSLL
jgi:hypothetical protein